MISTLENNWIPALPAVSLLFRLSRLDLTASSAVVVLLFPSAARSALLVSARRVVLL